MDYSYDLLPNLINSLRDGTNNPALSEKLGITSPPIQPIGVKTAPMDSKYPAFPQPMAHSPAPPIPTQVSTAAPPQPPGGGPLTQMPPGGGPGGSPGAEPAGGPTAPGFTPPGQPGEGYISAMQAKNANDYGRYLLAGGGQQDVKSPTQGISNVVAALIGGNILRNTGGRQASSEQGGVADAIHKLRIALNEGSNG